MARRSWSKASASEQRVVVQHGNVVAWAGIIGFGSGSMQPHGYDVAKADTVLQEG